jgi:hypothetical protein
MKKIRSRSFKSSSTCNPPRLFSLIFIVIAVGIIALWGCSQDQESITSATPPSMSTEPAVTTNAGPNLVGPAYPPPGGVSFSTSGGPSPGDPGGLNFIFTVFDPTAFKALWWGPQNQTAVAAGLNQTPHTLTFSSISGATATWTGTTDYRVPPSGNLVNVPVRCDITVTGMGSNPWVLSTSVPGLDPGVGTGIGAVVPNPSGLDFTATIEFKAYVGGSYIPLNTVPQLPGPIRTVSSFAGGFFFVVNEAPDCSGAAPSVDVLWPVNHKMKDIEITGVVDPDGDPVDIMIVGITQDEEVNGRGDGETWSDGSGIGTSTAQVRAERTGLGNGRVYKISFSASDDRGAECTGWVNVCVPHDMGDGCIDDGQMYDSTGDVPDAEGNSHQQLDRTK